MNTKEKPNKKQSNAEKPISLKPLKFDEAVEGLLRVPPEPQKGSKTKPRKESKNNAQEQN
jgi:hypothetical protein